VLLQAWLALDQCVPFGQRVHALENVVGDRTEGVDQGRVELPPPPGPRDVDGGGEAVGPVVHLDDVCQVEQPDEW